jgi:hypothetical protein
VDERRIEPFEKKMKKERATMNKKNHKQETLEKHVNK